MKPLFIGYCTPGPYEALADTLRANLDSFGIAHEIRKVPGRGNWQANTSMKGEVVRKFIADYPDRPMVYLDVDASVLSEPTLLNALADTDCDISAAVFGSCELLSGTVYFGPSQRTVDLVDLWIALCKQYPEMIPPGLMGQYPNGDFAWDQRLLALALSRMPGIKFVQLPPAYTYIHDLSKMQYPDVTPIIMHHAASRQYRDKACA
jgi:hypothetical protein